MILWIIPPFKQYKTGYFIYFLILAFADPVKLVLQLLFHLKSNGITLVVALLLISSLITTIKIKRILYSVSLIVFVLLIFFGSYNKLFMCSACVIHIIIFGRIIINLMNRFFHLQSLNLFLFLLIFYESICIFKYIAVIFSNETGPISWIIGGYTQMLFAVLFAFININTKEFPILRKLD
jgi:hypothetical protein